MDMNFYVPVKIITGKDCVKQNSDMFLNFGKKCIIVTGKSSAKKCGALDDITLALSSKNIQYTIYDGIEQNPSYLSCKKAADLAKNEKAEFVIGIGGGSPLDAAKAVAVLAVKDLTEDELFSSDWNANPLPVIAIGTTAGTGSEVTAVSVITASNGLKKSFKSPKVYPKVCFGDANYTMSLQSDFTRSTALDALSHCIEAYFNKMTNDIYKTFALRGISILLKMLEKTAKCDKAPLTFNDREKLYCASVYGGLAISGPGTAFPHAFGYFLSELFGVSHGNACAVYLEDFIDYNISVVPDMTQTFFDALRTDRDTLVALIKSNLPDMKITLTAEEINELLPRYENNKSLLKCYGNVNSEFAQKLLGKLFM